MTEPSTEQQNDIPEYAIGELSVHNSRSNLALGPIHTGAAAFGVSTVLLVFAYLAWLANVVAPADLVTATSVWVGALVGFFYPNDATE